VTDGTIVDVPTIALLGDKNLDYPTHRELDAAVGLMPDSIDARWIASDAPEARDLSGVDGLWVMPGSPYRDDDAVESAIGWALDTGTPLLATCSGFQYTAIVLARRLAGIADAVSAENDPDSASAVVVPLACSLVGSERLVTCVPGTRLAELCGTEPFVGFHWCNYGLADEFVGPLADAGVVISARAEDAGVEGIELPSHPFLVATLFQPQVGSLAGRPLHPLILAFLDAADKVRSAHGQLDDVVL
jgi:CTP synthase (UTP-ammonia lyase)